MLMGIGKVIIIHVAKHLLLVPLLACFENLQKMKNRFSNNIGGMRQKQLQNVKIKKYIGTSLSLLNGFYDVNQSS